MTDAEIANSLTRLGIDIRAEAALEEAHAALLAVRARAEGLAVPTNGPERRWRPYALVSVAAVVLLVVLGGVAWLRRGGDSVRLTNPTTPAPATEPATTTPTTTEATSVSSVVPSTTVADTEPLATAFPEPVANTVRVREVIRDAGPRPADEIFHSDDLALGYEDCGECDPVTPWGPVATDDGRVVIADELNRRWIVGARDGTSQTVPYPDGFRAISPPVIAPDDLLYIVNGNYDDSDGDFNNGNALLTAFELADLTRPVREVEIPRVSTSQLWFDGSRLLVNGRIVVDSVSPAAPELPTVEWQSPTSIAVTWNGTRRTWEFDQGVGAAAPAGGALADGSVLVVEVATRVTMRLFPDGTAVRFTLPAGHGYNGSRQVSATSVVQFGPSADGRVSVVRDYLPPASPSRVVEPASLAYESTGSAVDICRAAGIAVSSTGYDFESNVLADTTSVFDGTEWRWLFCTGAPESGWGVTVLVSGDSAIWRLTSLGFGYFTHAGDRAVATVEGARATVRWQSLVGERLVEATTSDVGATWAVADARSAEFDDAARSDGCDQPAPAEYDEFGTVHTVVEAANAPDIAVEYHVPLGTVCPGGQLDVTMLITNSSPQEVLFAPGSLLLGQGMPKWSFGNVPETAVPANESTYISVEATLPGSLRPGAYDLWAYGYSGTTTITVSEPNT